MIAQSNSLRLQLEVRDVEVVEELSKFPEGLERDSFALTALRIGVLALRHVRGELEIQAVQREADRLLRNLQETFRMHQQQLNEQLASALREYFDPNNGRFQERIQRLIGNGGELEQFLRQWIGREDSELCRTLLDHVGKDSPLMQYLSPQHREGLLAQLQSLVEKKLAEQRETILGEFSLDKSSSALRRFLDELRQHQQQVSGDLQTKITTVVGEFSLDRPDSALSRLVRNVEEAQRKVTSEFSLDKDDSALSRLRRELIELLENLRKNQQEFQEVVRKELAALRARREEKERSASHGLDFQDAVYKFLQQHLEPRGHKVEFVGNEPGKNNRSKVGDILITLSPETAAPGARIVVEVKEQEGYTKDKAWREIAEARQNREAQMGIFVFSKKVAPNDIPSLFRWENDLITVWDMEDPQTDLYLEAACLVAQALCVRQAQERSSAQADISKMKRALTAVEKGLEGLDSIETWMQTIQNNSKKVLEQLDKLRQQLRQQLDQLQECLESFEKLYQENKVAS